MAEENPKTVLVVEDNSLNMELVTDLLKIAGYRVLQAFTAEEGIRLTKAEIPDLILMDVGLPGMDGLEATRILKKEEAYKEIPVVCLSSFAMSQDKEKALQAGCAGYITKPIDTRAFVKTIASYFLTEKGKL